MYSLKGHPWPLVGGNFASKQSYQHFQPSVPKKMHIEVVTSVFTISVDGQHLSDLVAQNKADRRSLSIEITWKVGIRSGCHTNLNTPFPMHPKP